MSDDDLSNAPEGQPDLGRAGTSDHLDQRLPRWVRVYEWTLDHLGVLLLATIGAGLLVASAAGYEIPRWLRIFAIAAVAGGVLIGQPTASKVKELLWNPNDVWIVDLDAERRDGALYREPVQHLREWDVKDGRMDWLSPNLATAQNVDFQSAEAEGVWRGTLTDRELLLSLDAVRECRSLLEDQARRGRRIETQAWVIVRSAAVSATKQVIATFERGTLPDDGEGLTDAIDDTLEELGMERTLDRLGGDRDEDDPTTGLDLDLSDLQGAGGPDVVDRRDQEAPADD